MSRLRQAARKRLDRPGGRLILGAAASLWYSAKRRQPCLISWRQGAWAHRYRDATIPHERLGDAPSPAEFTAEARDIFLYGYEPREGDIVFDVGAGVGAETLLFSRLVGALGRVVALEAHPGTFDRLALLCRLNALANVVPLQAAAADVDGNLSISNADAHVANTILDVGEGGIAVPARRLYGVADELGITRVDLLKMNIEGAERDALVGMGELIEHTRHVCVSCHDFLAERGGPERLRTKAFVRDLLLEHGFSLTSRDNAPDPWTRDYLYGVNNRLT
jgi:FkbM family methyltransferase